MMTTAIVVLAVVLAAACLAVLLLMYLKLSEAVRVLAVLTQEPRPGNQFAATVSQMGHHGPEAVAPGYFSVWLWREGDWQPQPHLLPIGGAPGSPPPYAGAFEGDCAKTWVAA